MPDRPDWDPGRYRSLLRLQAHQLRRGARLRRPSGRTRSLGGAEGRGP